MRNGKLTETRVTKANGREIVETFENGVLKTRKVNGVQEALPSSSS